MKTIGHNKKNIGYDSEQVVINYLLDSGHKLVTKNFTIQGGEIDIITIYKTNLHFVEVKTINSIDDTYNILNKKKLTTLIKTIKHFLWKNNQYRYLTYQIDAAFVKNHILQEYFDNISY